MRDGVTEVGCEAVIYIPDVTLLLPAPLIIVHTVQMAIMNSVGRRQKLFIIAFIQDQIRM